MVSVCGELSSSSWNEKVSMKPNLNIPDLSIIVLNFNRLSETRFTIEHLIDLKKQRPCIEIIAVDNASSDSTWEYLNEKKDLVRIIRMSSNSGIEAINQACMKASSRYLMVLDDDSHPVDAECLDRIVETFDENKNVGVIACRIESGSGKRVREWHLPDNDVCVPSPAFIGCGFAIRRDLFRQTGWFPKEFFLYQNEIETSIQVKLAGFEIFFDPLCRVIHRFVPAGRTNARRVFYPTRNSLWLIRKYFDFPESLYLIAGRIVFGFIRAFEGREFRVYVRSIKEGFSPDVNKRILKGRELEYASVLFKQNSIFHHLLRRIVR